MFSLQRVSGILAFIYCNALMANTFAKSFLGKSVDYNLMHETLQHPLWAIFYIVCVLLLLFSISQMVYGHFV